MRYINTPEEGKGAIEDTEIRYFVADGKGNVAARREVVEIPANCGQFAKEAMILGFFMFFDRLVSPQLDDPKEVEIREKRIKEAEEKLKLFGETLQKARANVKAAEAEAAEAKAPTPIAGAGSPNPKLNNKAVSAKTEGGIMKPGMQP